MDVADRVAWEVGVKKVALVVVLAAIAYGVVAYFKDMDTRAFEAGSRERVARMFDCMTTTGFNEECAVRSWRSGTNLVVSGRDQTDFTRFWQSSGLPRRISGHEIVASRVFAREDVVGRYAEVTCRVDGRDLKIVVHHKEPLIWAR